MNGIAIGVLCGVNLYSVCLKPNDWSDHDCHICHLYHSIHPIDDIDIDALCPVLQVTLVAWKGSALVILCSGNVSRRFETIQDGSERFETIQDDSE